VQCSYYIWAKNARKAPPVNTPKRALKNTPLKGLWKRNILDFLVAVKRWLHRPPPPPPAGGKNSGGGGNIGIGFAIQQLDKVHHKLIIDMEF
jgi:hypothetical protein